MKDWSRILRKDRVSSRTRLNLSLSYENVYVIGDIHGCFDQLMSLEQKIYAEKKSTDREDLIITLGDYVDRGPRSADVIEHLLTPPNDNFERICLLGNHELAMHSYLENRLPLQSWLAIGGTQTLLSYGIDTERLQTVYSKSKLVDEKVRELVPNSHKQFLKNLPILIQTKRFLFVHAGIRPAKKIEDQTDHDLVNIRDEFYKNADLSDYIVIHGHTPVKSPQLKTNRLNIDTGAYRQGVLSAVKLNQDGMKFLSS